MARTPLLLIGRLFGTCLDELRERFDVTVVADFTARFESVIDANSLRVICVGMVGSGHISTLAVNAAFLDRFVCLEVVTCLGVGCEFVDLGAAEKRGIVITNTPGSNTEETADTAMGLLLCTVRQLPQADRFLRAGHWRHEMFPLSGTLRGKCLGILGLGSIGKAIARRAEGFGLDIIYHGRTDQPGVDYEYCASVLELARRCDILMVVVPGGEETFHLVNAKVLAALGEDGVLINIARGTVVDEAALVEALEQGTIANAGLDAFHDEPNVPEALLLMNHVVLTPNIGSGTHHTRAQMAQLVVDNLLEWNARGEVLNPLLTHA